MKPLMLFLPIALMTAALAAGCGGGSDSSTDNSADPGTTEFIAQADKVCKASNASIQKEILKELNGTTKQSKAQIISVTRKTIVPGLSAQFKELQKLTPPEEAVAGFDTFMSSYSADIQELKKSPELVVSGEPMKNSTVAAKNFGFNTCAGLGSN